MSSSSLRARSSAAVLAAAALLLTACGSQDPAAAPPPSSAPSSAASSAPAETAPAETALSPVQLVAASSDAAADAGSARIALRSVTKAQGTVQRITGSGLIDTEQQASSLDLRLGGKGTVQTRTVDGKSYLRLPGTAKWTVVPMTGGAGGAGSSDPAELLSMLRKASDDVRENGTEQIRGVEMKRYTGTLDLTKAVKAQGGAQAGQTAKMLEGLGISDVPFDVYLDPEGLPGRFRIAFDVEVAGSKISNATTLDFSDWGTDADITAPAESEISDQPLPGVGTLNS